MSTLRPVPLLMSYAWNNGLRFYIISPYIASLSALWLLASGRRFAKTLLRIGVTTIYIKVTKKRQQQTSITSMLDDELVNTLYSTELSKLYIITKKSQD